MVLMHYRKLALTGVIALGTIVGAGAASAAPYKVNGNDTLWLISKHYGISLSSLIKANPQIANPNIIRQGMVINLSGKSKATPVPIASTSFANQVVSLVNKERSKASLKPITSDSNLTAMALDKAKDMYNKHYFDHTSPTFGSPFDMMKSYNIRFTYAGENIAMGQKTPQEVMTAWMNSAGHRQNILSPNFTKIGAAYYKGEWVQEFIAN
jgi:uncharacterized YkwD family protein